ncbi:hypothetical protein VTK56DRAFT_4606 [Thermocarpiscus australiensis]
MLPFSLLLDIPFQEKVVNMPETTVLRTKLEREGNTRHIVIGPPPPDASNVNLNLKTVLSQRSSARKDLSTKPTSESGKNSRAHLTVKERQDAEHISGNYQLVGKVVHSRIYDYGMRMLLDLMIPEPYAFLLDGMSSWTEAIVRSHEVTVSAKDIDETNHTWLCDDRPTPATITNNYLFIIEKLAEAQGRFAGGEQHTQR